MNGIEMHGVLKPVAPHREAGAPQGDGGFGDVIAQAVKKVGDMEQKADRSVADLMQGKADVHETMIALQKADLSMRMLLTVRNKVVEAYREIMRMQF